MINTKTRNKDGLLFTNSGQPVSPKLFCPQCISKTFKFLLYVWLGPHFLKIILHNNMITLSRTASVIYLAETHTVYIYMFCSFGVSGHIWASAKHQNRCRKLRKPAELILTWIHSLWKVFRIICFVLSQVFRCQYIHTLATAWMAQDAHKKITKKSHIDPFVA